MPKRYYLDTCIWKDYFENRSDKFRPLGEWALRLIKIILYDEDNILFSDLVISELRNKYTSSEISKIMELPYKLGLLKKVVIKNPQYKEAKQVSSIRKVPFADAMHAILSRDNNAILVTRNSHFHLLADITKIYKPEELI